MVVKYCYDHKAEMPEKVSKTKKDQYGKFKVYNAHTYLGKMCFGIGEPPKEDKEEWIEDNIQASKEMVEDVKAEQEEEEVPTEIEPKTHEEKMWRAKEERERVVFEVKDQREIRKSLAVQMLRDLSLSEGGKIPESVMDRLYYWAWNGKWPKEER
jgi:hypothetical protein